MKNIRIYNKNIQIIMIKQYRYIKNVFLVYSFEEIQRSDVPRRVRGPAGASGARSKHKNVSGS